MKDSTSNTIGRPSDYTPEITDEICARLSSGESLRSICKDEDMPSAVTVFAWIRKHPEFLKQYEKAKEESADFWAEEIIDIADDGTNDWMEKHGKEGECIGWQLNGEHVQRSRLRVDARKWVASKLKPKKYGDKIQQEVSGKDGGAIQVSDMSERELARRIAFTLAKGTKNLESKNSSETETTTQG